MERELWKALYCLARTLDKPWGAWRYSVSEILAVYFWAVVHDRPVCWAAEPANWPDDLRPDPLPPACTVTRRLKRPAVVELLTAIEQQLGTLLAGAQHLLLNLDAKALAVSGVSKDPDAGYGRGAGAKQKGYKLHAIWGAGGPVPVAWGLAPMQVSEQKMAAGLLTDLPGGGYIAADTVYDSNTLYDRAAESGFQLVVKKRRGGLGHQRQSPHRLRSIELLTTPFGRALYCARSTIECCFGTLVSTGGGLGPLPAWVRRFHRVRNWVQAKLLVMGVRWLYLHQPEKLADA